MKEYQEQLKDISEIRSLMEESSKFLSLSGLSGISAGVIALIGALGTYRFLDEKGVYGQLTSPYVRIEIDLLWTLFAIALVILGLAIGFASLFSIRMARKKELPIWNKTASKLAINLLIPLITGAIFCFLLAFYGFAAMVAPATLIFYGLALLNASKYTLKEIRYLAISEIVLGLISAIYLGYGIFFWAVGFGLLHIIYGVLMYTKHER